MGLFFPPKCSIHRTRMSIGSNGLEKYYYCRKCYIEEKRRIEEKEEK